MRKLFICAVLTVFVAMASLFSSSMANAQSTAAAGSTENCEAIGNDADGDGKPDHVLNFLSFPPWYRGLDCDTGSAGIHIKDDTEVGTVIFTVSLNLIDIVLRLIGIMAVGFVIYGGFQYVISRGEPEHTKAAHLLPFRHCEPLKAAWQSTRVRA